MVRFAAKAAHGEKLKALSTVNQKPPESDRERLEGKIERYRAWVAAMDASTSGGEVLLRQRVDLLNAYKTSVEFDFIFCSDDDCLYRRKSQLKLDNTGLEEFLPRFFDPRLVPGLARASGLDCGPRKSVAGLSFESPMLALSHGGVFVKKKDQDFSVTRRRRLDITTADRPANSYCKDINVAYFATGIKTNLDKTMFQEAAATAAELKRATSGSRYILLMRVARHETGHDQTHRH